MKYIDADKIKAEIDKITESLTKSCNPDPLGTTEECMTAAEIEALGLVKSVIDQMQHEKPEVELEKFAEKIKTFQGRYKHPESISINGAMAFMARMFYQYPNVARQWYEQLPKATMD